MSVQHQRPLFTTRTHLTAQLTQLTTKRENLLRQGRAAASTAKQRVLARQIQTIQREIEGARARLSLVERQLTLIQRLQLAGEMAGVLTAVQRTTFWSQLEWTAVPDSAHLDKLDAVVERLETAVVAQLPPAPRQSPPPDSQSLITVERVVDGDTIVIAGGERVRYIGMNCPEMRGWDGKSEPYAELATKRNRQLVEGKKVRLVKDVSERDKYGRLLRYVYVGDKFINAQLVREGLAYAFILPPDTGLSGKIEALEKEAQRLRRGVWQLK